MLRSLFAQEYKEKKGLFKLTIRYWGYAGQEDKVTSLEMGKGEKKKKKEELI